MKQTEANLDFDERLNELWTHRHDGIKEAMHDDLLTLLVQSKEELDCVSYVKLMYLMGRYYEQTENSNGSRFCAMRIYMVMDCLKHKYRKRPRFLSFQDMELEEDVVLFLEERLAFLKETYRFMRQKLALILLVCCLIVLGVSVFMQASILLSMILCVILFGFGFWLFERRLKDRFHDRQTKALLPYICLLYTSRCV